MSDGIHRIRYCAVIECNVRMSAVQKDPHLLCPTHTGFQCNLETRCEVCKEWSDDQMLEYIKLQEGKARRKAHKDRKRAMKAETASDVRPRHAHSLSPTSSSSISSSGEPVSVPFVGQESVSNVFGDGNFKAVSSSDRTEFISPSDISLQSRVRPRPRDLGYVGQASAIPHRIHSLDSRGKDDPEPLKVSEYNPPCVGQPPQKLTEREIEQEYSTPSTSGASRRSSGSFRFTPSVYNSLKGVLEEHKRASDKEKMRIMLDSLMDIDPSFSGRSSSSSKSRRSRSSTRTERESRSAGRNKSAGFARHISPSRGDKETLEVKPVEVGMAGTSGESPKLTPQVELSREWARMVQTGGVSVISGASCYFKDRTGNRKFVHPPTVSTRGGEESWAEVRAVSPFGCAGLFSQRGRHRWD